MSTPILHEPDLTQDRSRTESAVNVDHLRERAAAIRRARPHTGRARPGPDQANEPRASERGEWPMVAQERENFEAARGREDQRGSQLRRRDLESVRERTDRARAEEALAKVRNTGWWDNATAGDLERVRTVANATGTPSSSRAAIRNEMQDVSQRRYGSSVDGAIRYERENPNQPPPDMRSSGIARS